MNHSGVIPVSQGDKNWNAHFGVCPDCHKSDGFINLGRGHWFYCAQHKVCWYVGSNLLSSWREQSIDEQRQIFDRLGFETFRRIRERRAA